MDLTPQEQRELKQLETWPKQLPMLPPTFCRLIQLQGKLWHNECINPMCDAGTHTDDQTECVQCGSKLFKIIDSV